MRYFCPYCSLRYQIHKKRSDGVMVCEYCGDPLVKVQAIKPTQVFALIAAFAFIAPLLMTAFVFIQDLKRPQTQRSMQAMNVVLICDLLSGVSSPTHLWNGDVA